MSLADIKAEIDRKRKLTETALPGTKYARKGDVEKALRQAKPLKSKEEEKAKAEEEKKKKKEEEDKALDDVPEEKEEEPPMPLMEIIKRLRERGQPITLFAESEWKRYQRLRALEEREPIEYLIDTDEDFGRKLLDEEEEIGKKKDELAELFKHAGQSEGGLMGSGFDFTGEEGKLKMDPKLAKDKEEYILVLIKTLLSEWEHELNDRPDTEKKTAQGKVATATYKQCRKHIKPLIKLLNHRSLPFDILAPVHTICCLIRDRDYLKANDTYLQMAIGNAPWPMGVTMVGIHERSAREKIFSNQVAHVLNDETQRKYIQGIKRIMSWAQHKYPNDPSKCVG